jgi:hypothetical protein
MLEGKPETGVHYMACAVLGELAEDFSTETWQRPPSAVIDKDQIRICGGDGIVLTEIYLED